MSCYLKSRLCSTKPWSAVVSPVLGSLSLSSRLAHSLKQFLVIGSLKNKAAQPGNTYSCRRHTGNRRAIGGFSLVEMMVVISLLAIMSAIAVPSFTQMIAGNSVDAAANELYGLLQYARGEAVSRGQRVTVSAGASDTWAATLDVSALKDGETVTLRHYESLNQPKVTAVTAAQSLSALAFYSNGSSSGSTQITLCHSTDSSVAGRAISVARSGQVSPPQSTSCE